MDSKKDKSNLFEELKEISVLTEETIESLIKKYSIVVGEKCLIPDCYLRVVPHTVFCQKHLTNSNKIV